MFVSSLSASCNTVRRRKQLHLDAGRMAVLVRSGSAAQPSNCTRPLVLKIPAQVSQDLPWEAEVRCPGPHHRKTDPLEGLRQSQDQGQGSLIVVPCYTTKSFHLQLNFTHCLLGSSISPTSSVPIHTILMLSLRHFRSTHSFPPTNQCRHERDRSLTRNILRYQEQHRCASLLRPLSTLLHLLQEHHHFSSCFSCQFQGNLRGGSHHIPLLSSPSANFRC